MTAPAATDKKEGKKQEHHGGGHGHGLPWWAIALLLLLAGRAFLDGLAKQPHVDTQHYEQVNGRGIATSVPVPAPPPPPEEDAAPASGKIRLPAYNENDERADPIVVPSGMKLCPDADPGKFFRYYHDGAFPDIQESSHWYAKLPDREVNENAESFMSQGEAFDLYYRFVRTNQSC